MDQNKNTTIGEEVVVVETSTDHSFVVDDTPEPNSNPIGEKNEGYKSDNVVEEDVKQEPIKEVTVYTQTEAYTSPVKEISPEFDEIQLPSTTKEDLQKQLELITDNDAGADEESAKWLSSLLEGNDYNNYDDGLSTSVLREGSHWHQFVESPVGKLMPSKPVFPIKENTEYSGEAKLFRFKSKLGMGTAFTIPLWHSGFWVTIKTPAESELLELYREITSNKVSLGRSSFGLMFSNTMSYTYSAILDFVIRNSYGTTINLNDNVDIREYIDDRDLLPLFLGLTAATWPKGVEYKRGCVADPEDCRYVTTERINPAKLLWVDTTQLTERQRIHMSKRSPKSMTVEEVNLYKSEMVLGTDQVTKIGDCEITFRTPNAKEYIESGVRWIGVLENRYKNSLLEETSDREKYLISQAKSTALRQYSHYVKSIKVDEISADKIDEIEAVLDLISSDDKLRADFFEKIAKYIDNSVLAIVGIPTFKCPNCGKEHSPFKDKGVFSTIIPIDVVTCFFTLIAQKVSRIEAR